MKRFKKIILNKILNYVLSNYFKALTEEDIFVSNKKNGKIYIKGREVEEKYRIKLSKDADKIVNSKMWDLIKNECEYQANLKMFQTSGRDMDLLFGKAMIHSIKVLDIKLKQLSSMN